jgi:hypothetical protein
MMCSDGPVASYSLSISSGKVTAKSAWFTTTARRHIWLCHIVEVVHNAASIYSNSRVSNTLTRCRLLIQPLCKWWLVADVSLRGKRCPSSPGEPSADDCHRRRRAMLREGSAPRRGCRSVGRSGARREAERHRNRVTVVRHGNPGSMKVGSVSLE